MGVSVTEERLKQRGYMPFLEYYLQIKYKDAVRRTAVYQVPLWRGGVRGLRWVVRIHSSLLDCVAFLVFPFNVYGRGFTIVPVDDQGVFTYRDNLSFLDKVVVIYY